MTDIHHDAVAHRFITEADGHTAYVEYETGDGHIVITHTIVPSEIGGRGIAAALVRTALEYARTACGPAVLVCRCVDAPASGV